jgi:hypothetical protein
MQTAIMACMRDECMFVLEWVAYHRLIGFDHVFIATNDCSDGTDRLCDRLARMGLVTHIRNDDHGATPPQIAGVARVLAHPDTRDLRWLLHIDADEFLNIPDGDGRLDGWLPRLGDHDAAALAWRLFGDGGLDHWPEGGLQTEEFTLAADQPRPFTAMQKTMFRPSAFGAGIDHMPKQPRHTGVTLCNALGRPLHPGALHHATECDHRAAGGGEVNRKRHFPWEGAVINHYAVRTRDLFLLKNWRGDGKRSRFNKRYFLNSRWHRAANCNEVEETSIQRHLPELRLLMAHWRAEDPKIARIEAKAYARMASARDTILTEAEVERLTNLRDVA